MIKLIYIKLLLLSFVPIFNIAQSHSITLDASQNITNFMFTNSDGEVDKKYKPVLSGGYAFGYRFENEKGLLLSGKLGMRNAGATYVYDSFNYNWDFDYTEVRLGVGYNYKLSKIGIHIWGQPYFSYLLKANQTLNNEHFDLINSDKINRVDYGAIISTGVNISAAEDLIKLFIDLNYLYGINNIEKSDNQKTQNNMLGGTIGIAINLKKS